MFACSSLLAVELSAASSVCLPLDPPLDHPLPPPRPVQSQAIPPRSFSTSDYIQRDTFGHMLLILLWRAAVQHVGHPPELPNLALSAPYIPIQAEQYCFHQHYHLQVAETCKIPSQSNSDHADW